MRSKVSLRRPPPGGAEGGVGGRRKPVEKTAVGGLFDNLTGKENPFPCFFASIQEITSARTLSRPDVLILDEVCTHLDGDARTQIYQFLNDSRHERVTLLIAHEALPDGLVNVWLNREEAPNACGA